MALTHGKVNKDVTYHRYDPDDYKNLPEISIPSIANSLDFVHLMERDTNWIAESIVQGTAMQTISGVCKDYFSQKVADGARNLSGLYDRQLRPRIANLRLGLHHGSGALDAELQSHTVQSAELLSSALRTKDAL